MVTPYFSAHHDHEWAADPAARVPWELLEAADTAALFFHLDGTNDIHRFHTLKELFPGETGDYAG